jgi:hypothetical protein
MLGRGETKSSIFMERYAGVRTRPQESPYRRRNAKSIRMRGFTEVPSMAIVIVGIFLTIIAGAAAAFACVLYLYLGDDGGRTAP